METITIAVICTIGVVALTLLIKLMLYFIFKGSEESYIDKILEEIHFISNEGVSTSRVYIIERKYSNGRIKIIKEEIYL